MDELEDVGGVARWLLILVALIWVAWMGLLVWALVAVVRANPEAVLAVVYTALAVFSLWAAHDVVRGKS